MVACILKLYITFRLAVPLDLFKFMNELSAAGNACADVWYW
jgi:hypothetical protein